MLYTPQNHFTPWRISISEFLELLLCYMSSYREKMADSERNLANTPSESKADKAKQLAIPPRVWYSLEGQRELGTPII